MTNHVGFDETAPSGSALFRYAILSKTIVYEILGHLPCFQLLFCLPAIFVTFILMSVSPYLP